MIRNNYVKCPTSGNIELGNQEIVKISTNPSDFDIKTVHIEYANTGKIASFNQDEEN